HRLGRPCEAPGAVADEARAEQRRGVLVGEAVGDRKGVADVRDHDVGIAAVAGPAGELRPVAQVLAAARAERAGPARPAQPRHAEAPADLQIHAGPGRLHAPDDLMAGYARRAPGRE